MDLKQSYNIIGFFLNDELRTGGHRRYLELLSGLSEKGHNVLVVLNSKVYIPFHTGFSAIRVPVDTKRKRAVEFKRSIEQNIGRIAAEMPGADYVVLFGETNFFAGAFLKNYYRARMLFSFRSNMILEDRYKIKSGEAGLKNAAKLYIEIAKYWLYETMIGKKADTLVFQSAFDKSSYLSRHPLLKNNNIPKIEVIGGNTLTPWFDPVFAKTNTSLRLNTLLFIGSINKRKGVELLLEAFEALSSSYPNLRLIIVGFGPDEDKLKDRLSTSPCYDKITFTGRSGNPFSFLKDADLLVVPSLFDSYPNVILEAVHSGTPVIAARTGGIPEMLEHQDLMFEPGSATAIQEKIEALCSDNSEFLKVKQLVENLQSKFAFDWVGEFEKLLD